MNYIKGIIVEIESNYIVIDNNGIGYEVYTPNPYSFTLNNEYKVYIYEYIREDEHTLYGFKEIEEKELFLKLIEVKGLGCKMALPMLALGSIEGIEDAIERGNILYLKKFPKIGDKVARQIILDLKGKLVNNNEPINDNSELVEALKSLGYKVPDINKVIPNVDKSKDIGEQIKEALKLMLK
ncbi:MAG: Holliday junction branch migration protein RuvA [Bacilli bacterium]|nr:Holliday junction branch migration protein RuvA [Bacilli bacterium]